MMEEGVVKPRFDPKPLLITTGIYIAVLLIGAAVFMAIEKKPDDSDHQAASLRTVSETVKNITKTYNMSAEDEKKLKDAILQGKEVEDQAGKPKWSYSNSVFFTFTIMTTIGYGHLAPKTWKGQLFCIFFSMVAIPVTGLMLINVGNAVSRSIQAFIKFVEKRCLRKEVPCNAELKSTVATLFFMMIMIVCGAVLTSHTDNWSFIEGVYFTFISVSTIGFGDYIINDGDLKHPDTTKTIAVNFVVVLITIGLCVLSSVLCSVSAVIEQRQKRLRVRLPNASNPLKSIKMPNKGRVGESSSEEASVENLNAKIDLQESAAQL